MINPVSDQVFVHKRLSKQTLCLLLYIYYIVCFYKWTRKNYMSMATWLHLSLSVIKKSYVKMDHGISIVFFGARWFTIA